MPLFSSPRRALARLIVMLSLSALLTGCASSTSGPDFNPRPAYAHVTHDMRQPAQTIRYGRYTILSARPKADQVQLMEQIIDIRIPDTLAPTVHQAMVYALRHSGYQLCPGAGDVALLFSHPLPASHYKLGPITVRDALQTLAGPAWELRVDDLARSVCFGIRNEYRHPTTKASTGTTAAVPAPQGVQ